MFEGSNVCDYLHTFDLVPELFFFFLLQNLFSMALFPFKPLPHEMILGGFWFLFLNETHFCQFESKPKVTLLETLS